MPTKTIPAKKTSKPVTKAPTKAKKPVAFSSINALVTAKRGYSRKPFPRGLVVIISADGRFTATINGQTEPALASTHLGDGMAMLLKSFGIAVETHAGKAKATSKKKPLAKGKAAKSNPATALGHE